MVFEWIVEMYSKNHTLWLRQRIGSHAVFARYNEHIADRYSVIYSHSIAIGGLPGIF